MALQPPNSPTPNPAMPPPGARPMPMPQPGMKAMPPGAPVPPGAPLPPGAKLPPGAPPPGAMPPPQQDEGPIQLGFFQQPWVQNVLPFVTSIVAHIVIIVLGGLVFAVATKMIDPDKLLNREQTVIPTAAAQTSHMVGGVPNVGTNDDPNHIMQQDVDQNAATPDGNSTNPGASIDPSAGGAAGSGTAVAHALNGGGPGGGIGGGDGFGGGGKGGRMARFGPPGGGASGPRGPVFGNGGNAKNIVFVCDASGSMTNKFASLKEQLNKAISKLRVPQTFDVVFFQDAKATVFSRDRLKQESLEIANLDNKRNASAFLEEVTVSSTSDPIPGLTVAFARHPDLIYLLTDGDFPDNDAVYKKVKELNKPDANGKKAKINTIAFIDPAKDTEKDFQVLLQKIADENDGQFRLVNEQELDE